MVQSASDDPRFALMSQKVGGGKDGTMGEKMRRYRQRPHPISGIPEGEAGLGLLSLKGLGRKLSPRIHCDVQNGWQLDSILSLEHRHTHQYSTASLKTFVKKFCRKKETF